MTTRRRCQRARASARRAGPLLALFAVLGAVSLPGCGKEAPRDAPPQNGKPAEAPPSQPEAEPKEEQSTTPSTLEKDRAADEAPAVAPFAPPPPATPAPSSAKADAQTRPRRAAPAKRAGPPATSDGPDWSPRAPLTPQVLRQRLDDAVRLSTPDCPSARDRKQAICDLANQICQLVDRDPDVASVESYCDDAKRRCSEAEHRTAQRCR